MDKITHKVRCEQWTKIIKECLASGMNKHYIQIIKNIMIMCAIDAIIKYILETVKVFL